MAISTQHPAGASALGARFDSRFFETWARVGILYKDALDASAQDMVVSSARIVQEHSLRAWVAASQACSQALAQNAAAVQQQSFDRFLDANRKAAEIMGQSWLDAMTPKIAWPR